MPPETDNIGLYMLRRDTLEVSCQSIESIRMTPSWNGLDIEDDNDCFDL